MTTNQTIDGVPRELLERLHAEHVSIAGPGFWTAWRELRALLDADKCTSCDGSGEYIDAIGDWRGYCSCAAGVALENKPAAQPKGEPVACVIAFREGVKEPEILSWNQLPVGEHRLYAEQPAPVACVQHRGEPCQCVPCKPAPLNYGSLDAVQRLAVCRGDVVSVSGSTCNEIREEAGQPINLPCKACGGGACIDR